VDFIKNYSITHGNDFDYAVGIYGIDAATGATQWSRMVHNCIFSETSDDDSAGHRVALAPSGLLLVACGSHGGVSSAFEPTTGALVWSVPSA
jgi:outer membrane protein assembly factor BamB